MKSIAKLFLILALAVPAAAYAADSGTATTDLKDPCLLSVSACPNQVDSLTEKISKLQRELQKGTAVYTPQEMRILERELSDYLGYYDNLVYSGGA